METVRIVDKAPFAVLGKEGAGPSEGSLAWIAPLWKEATEHFAEIAPFCLRDEAGRFTGFWGAMDDMDRTFHPWRDGVGRYLAGCEAPLDAPTPEGWSRWVLPACRYAVLPCTMRTYGEAMRKVLREYFPQNGFLLVGPIQESYGPGNAAGELELYFPFERIE